jgi:hypothetical protein
MLSVMLILTSKLKANEEKTLNIQGVRLHAKVTYDNNSGAE